MVVKGKAGTVDREIRALVRKLEAQGWRVVDGGKHLKAFPPDRTKPMVTLAKTPSDRRSIKNAMSQLRRSGAQL
jgi:hypothetical protein